jgi:hypothetical protein
MADYLQQEANTDHLLLEDGSGGFLLETSQHTATVTGGGTVSGSGAKNAFGSATVTGGGSVSATGTASTPAPPPVVVETTGGGNVHMPPPRRRQPAPQPVPVIRFGSAIVTGGGTIQAAGRKHASGGATITGGGTINATGYKSSEIALVRFQPDGSMTTEPVRVLTLEEELQQLVEDAAVLAEALN